MTGRRQEPPLRKISRESAERDWLLADIENVKAERLKFGVETKQIREQVKTDEYNRMLRETDSRGRREYDFADEVDWESSAEIIAVLSDWVEESDAPILVRLNTPGGDEVGGLAIVDFIRAANNAGARIDTLALGQASSMGSVLLQAGKTRLVSKHAVVLIHESRTFGEDAPVMEHLSNMEDRVELGKLLERMCNDLLAERSTFESGEALAVHYGSKDWWLSADEAVSYGFADTIWT